MEELATTVQSLDGRPIKQVQEMICDVDLEGNGTMDFEEFLIVMGRKQKVINNISGTCMIHKWRANYYYYLKYIKKKRISGCFYMEMLVVFYETIGLMYIHVCNSCRKMLLRNYKKLSKFSTGTRTDIFRLMRWRSLLVPPNLIFCLDLYSLMQLHNYYLPVNISSNSLSYYMSF